MWKMLLVGEPAKEGTLDLLFVKREDLVGAVMFGDHLDVIMKC